MRDADLDLLRGKLEEIKGMGWIRNQRPGNAGGVGNTLEDLLDVAENNLQIPDFGEWELKTQRADTGSLLTLFHTEPMPRAARIVPQILLLKYGWPHSEAGTTYPANERSFRQTINATAYSDRGFRVNVDNNSQTVFIDFDFSRIDDRHAEWRASVESRIGTGDVNPNPFWTFREIEEKLSSKINNLMYIRADRKTEGGEEFFKYNQMEAYVDPTLERFLSLIKDGIIYVDFDARTGHNHGTKFRMRPARKTDLYQKHLVV